MDTSLSFHKHCDYVSDRIDKRNNIPKALADRPGDRITGYKTGARYSQNASVKGSGRVPKSVHSPVNIEYQK